MKNLAEFKRRTEVGKIVETIHLNFGSFGDRKITIKQSNSFAMETTRPGGEVVNSWSQYPKAKDIEFEGENTAHIFWGEGDNREKILTYIFKD